jgi:hypothetical protein
MAESGVPKLERVFVLSSRAELSPEILDPRTVREGVLRGGWEYVMDTFNDKTVVDLSLFLTGGPETDAPDRPLRCEVRVRTVWESGHVDGEEVRREAVKYLQQACVDTVDELLNRLGVGAVQIAPTQLTPDSEGE